MRRAGQQHRSWIKYLKTLKETLCAGKRCHILAIGVVLCLLLWVIDTAIDTLGLPDSSFWLQLIAPNPHKVLNHSQAAAVLFLLVIFSDFLLKKRNDVELHLHETLATALREKSQSEGILEALGDAISIQDTSFRIIYQNQLHRTMMGEHKGEHCYQAYGKRSSVCDDCLLVRAFRDGGAYTKEKSGISQDGPVIVEITASVLRDQSGTIIAGIEAVRDISERRKAEGEILRLNNDLMRQAEELKAVNNDLQAFSYSVSHDLRAPLTRITCSAEALRTSYREQLDEDGRFFLDNLSHASDQMRILIEAMLDLSRVTRSELVRRELDLVALARSIEADLRQGVVARTVLFVTPEKLMVMGDERMLRIALENLLGNAWKFSEKRDQARIALGMELQEDVPVYFVSDNGDGFDMKEFDRLFIPFNRLHKDTEFPGTGIGLATVQRVIHRHGGRIWAESSPGQGATFFFTLSTPSSDSDTPA